MAKIALSTPELDKLAMRTDFHLQTPVLNTFLRNEDSDEDKLKMNQLWQVNSKQSKKDDIITEEFKFMPNASKITGIS